MYAIAETVGISLEGRQNILSPHLSLLVLIIQSSYNKIKYLWRTVSWFSLVYGVRKFVRLVIHISFDSLRRDESALLYSK